MNEITKLKKAAVILTFLACSVCALLWGGVNGVKVGYDTQIELENPGMGRINIITGGLSFDQHLFLRYAPMTFLFILAGGIFLYSRDQFSQALGTCLTTIAGIIGISVIFLKRDFSSNVPLFATPTSSRWLAETLILDVFCVILSVGILVTSVISIFSRSSAGEKPDQK